MTLGVEVEMTAMESFYREVDRHVADLGERLGVVCGGCGGCCHFDVEEHILYASDLERRYLVHVSPRDAGGGRERDLLIADGARCPFQVDDRCTARAGRVLGCRLHYCDPKWRGEAGELSEHCHRKLKELHVALRAEWRYAPLLPLPNTPKPLSERRE